MPSSVRISSPVILSPPNHKTLRNSEQDVTWQVQPITLSDAWHWEWIAFTHDTVSTPNIKLFFSPHVYERLFFWTTPRIQMQLPWTQINSQCKWSWKLTSRDLFNIFLDSEHCGKSRCQVIHPASFIDEELVGSWSLRKSCVLQINLKISFIFLSSSTRTHISWTAVPLDFLLRWLVASCSLSWTLIWVFNQ